ncbi:hypothetical protein BH20BAC1_BH20BAC1_16650 [soil metagenome]
MDRRLAIKNLAIASGSLITLPFWMQACGVSDTDTHDSSFSKSEQELFASLTDTIIPAGNSIGALSVGVDKYLQKLFDDCYGKQDLDSIRNRLTAMNASAKKTYGKSFTQCTPAQREELLIKWSASDVKEEREFFDLVKKETISGFNTSQKVMEEYLDYQIAPGHYYGSVNVKA